MGDQAPDDMQTFPPYKLDERYPGRERPEQGVTRGWRESLGESRVYAGGRGQRGWGAERVGRGVGGKEVSEGVRGRMRL